jgi:hypothetical protein
MSRSGVMWMDTIGGTSSLTVTTVSGGFHVIRKGHRSKPWRGASRSPSVGRSRVGGNGSPRGH